MKKVVTMGDLMISLVAPDNERFTQASSFNVFYTGAEANVSVSLAILGLHSVYMTRVPDNDIGQCALNALRKYGVDVSLCPKGGSRLGVLYMEKGTAQRPSKVIYDRWGSGICEAEPEHFDWEAAFSGADWFHFTGITPGLTDKTAALTLYACKKAKEMGLTVSCDPNYRSKLWTKEKARSVMSKILPYVDVLITNEGQSADIFGIVPPNPSPIGVPTSHESAIFIAEELRKRFGCGKVAITIRTTLSGNDHNFTAMLSDGTGYYFSREYKMHVLDRVGGGDAFAAGLIFAGESGYDPQYGIEFATAASVLKHSIESDFNLSTLDEIKALAGGDGTGNIKR